MIWRASSAFVAVSLFATAAQANFFSDKVAKNFDLKKEIGTGISVIAQPTIDSAQPAAQVLQRRQAPKLPMRPISHLRDVYVRRRIDVALVFF